MINTAHDELEPILAYTNPINAASDEQLHDAEQQRRNAINASELDQGPIDETRRAGRTGNPVAVTIREWLAETGTSGGSPAARAPYAATKPYLASKGFCQPRKRSGHARNHHRYNGTRYDTRRREFLGQGFSAANRGDFSFWKASLYRTPRWRAYFLAGQWRADDAGSRCRPGRTHGRAGSKVIPLTESEALEWASSTLTRARSRRRSGASSRTRNAERGRAALVIGAAFAMLCCGTTGDASDASTPHAAQRPLRRRPTRIEPQHRRRIPPSRARRQTQRANHSRMPMRPKRRIHILDHQLVIQQNRDVPDARAPPRDHAAS